MPIEVGLYGDPITLDIPDGMDDAPVPIKVVSSP
jgi:hypothetical protein